MSAANLLEADVRAIAREEALKAIAEKEARDAERLNAAILRALQPGGELPRHLRGERQGAAGSSGDEQLTQDLQANTRLLDEGGHHEHQVAIPLAGQGDEPLVEPRDQGVDHVTDMAVIDAAAHAPHAATSTVPFAGKSP